ncbi:MAG: glycoside hydrolase family 32 protein [Clostridiales bacterium]|nr:glycoside hydrolase family 32 protein [Clostridiales bacterium]
MNWRQKIHLEPREGWMNDPNGLCYFAGNYHVFFQYSPDSPEGSGRKCWGHFVSPDLKSFEYKGIVFYPDIPEDINGAFSGGAIVKDGNMHIFYTGNVEYPGDYDYINEGRGANQIHVVSSDGELFGGKKVILRNKDYPCDCSCHVRDPKVWIEDGKWKMVLGARTKDGRGEVLFFEADDPDEWKFVKLLTSPDMGYMWECPDLFTVGDKKYLAICPQGLSHEEYRYQNVYSSGYFGFKDGELTDFEEFDYGFDFYAPQTFLDENGDRILIGWMGIGDIPYQNPTTELGWQHCLTIPRKLTSSPDGGICQIPLAEYCDYKEGEPFAVILDRDKVYESFTIYVGDAVIRYDRRVLSLEFGKSGYGRNIRKVRCGILSDLKILADSSSLEIFVNGGRYVLSSRFYPDETPIIRSYGCEVRPEGIKPLKISWNLP